jgi:hypothetical protein
MSVRELPTREWPEFLDGGLIEVREQPLESSHVDDPQALRVEETADGATEVLQIDDAAGRRLTLRFRVAAAPGALDGLAPGER